MKKIILMLAMGAFVATNAEAQKKKKEVIVEESPKRVIKIEKSTKGRDGEEVLDIQAPRTRIYKFKSNDDTSWQVDTLIDGERVLKHGDGFTWEDNYPRISKNFSDNVRTFRFNSDELFDKLSIDMNNLKYELNGIDFKQNFNSNEGFSNVNVYTNKPATHILNLRFKSAEEGAVTISVINLVGELVQKETIEDFKGEYLGQINLKEGTKGTFFVIIAQGEKGISRKVKVD
jgi:hypothetical protein